MSKYTYQESKNRVTIYDGNDIIAEVYDLGDEYEVEVNRTLNDKEINMIKKFIGGRPKNVEWKDNSNMYTDPMIEAWDIVEDEPSKKLTESVKSKPTKKKSEHKLIMEKLKRWDYDAFDRRGEVLGLAHDYSRLTEGINYKDRQAVDQVMKTVRDPEEAKKAISGIMNGGVVENLNESCDVCEIIQSPILCDYFNDFYSGMGGYSEFEETPNGGYVLKGSPYDDPMEFADASEFEDFLDYQFRSAFEAGALDDWDMHTEEECAQELGY